MAIVYRSKEGGPEARGPLRAVLDTARGVRGADVGAWRVHGYN